LASAVLTESDPLSDFSNVLKSRRSSCHSENTCTRHKDKLAPNKTGNGNRSIRKSLDVEILYRGISKNAVTRYNQQRRIPAFFTVRPTTSENAKMRSADKSKRSGGVCGPVSGARLKPFRPDGNTPACQDRNAT